MSGRSYIMEVKNIFERKPYQVLVAGEKPDKKSIKDAKKDVAFMTKNTSMSRKLYYLDLRVNHIRVL